MSETNRNYKSIENHVRSSSPGEKEFEDSSKPVCQPTASKLVKEGFFNNEETDPEMFIKDPLF